MSSSAFELQNNGCPMCGSRRKVDKGQPAKRDAHFARFNGELDPVQITRCQDCSGMYVSPMIYVGDELLSEIYGADYFNSEMKNVAEKQNILRIAQGVLGPLEHKKLLDIGCGTGEYLKTASDLDMDVFGIDVNQASAKRLQQLGYNVIIGKFSADTFPPGTFDVIVLSHVVEHLQEPAGLLSSIHTALKPDGLFVMCMPNTDSLMEDLHDVYTRMKHSGKTGYLSPFTNPYHILGFNLKSARILLNRCGFSPVYCRLHSGLEWEDQTRKLIMRSIKVAGAVLGKGMSIVTISKRK